MSNRMSDAGIVICRTIIERFVSKKERKRSLKAVNHRNLFGQSVIIGVLKKGVY